MTETTKEGEPIEAAAQPDAEPTNELIGEAPPIQGPLRLVTPDPDDAPIPQFYRVLPWSGRTLEQQLNQAAADGWRIAATVDVYIIMERW